MKKFFLFSLSALAILSYFGCGKTLPDNPACTNALPYSDSNTLKKFAGDSISLTLDSSGMFYHIIDPGSSDKITLKDSMTVNYIGKTMWNQIFDSASNSKLNNLRLNQLILGWQMGLPKIGVGGHILLFVPSAYAWGCTGYGGVGPNQPVFFDITLLKVN